MVVYISLAVAAYIYIWKKIDVSHTTQPSPQKHSKKTAIFSFIKYLYN